MARVSFCLRGWIVGQRGTNGAACHEMVLCRHGLLRIIKLFNYLEKRDRGGGLMGVGWRNYEEFLFLSSLELKFPANLVTFFASN